MVMTSLFSWHDQLLLTEFGMTIDWKAKNLVQKLIYFLVYQFVWGHLGLFKYVSSLLIGWLFILIPTAHHQTKLPSRRAGLRVRISLLLPSKLPVWREVRLPGPLWWEELCCASPYILRMLRWVKHTCLLTGVNDISFTALKLWGNKESPHKRVWISSRPWNWVQ